MAVLSQNIRVPFQMDEKKSEEFFRQADRTAYTRAVERAMAHKSGNSRPQKGTKKAVYLCRE